MPHDVAQKTKNEDEGTRSSSSQGAEGHPCSQTRLTRLAASREAVGGQAVEQLLKVSRARATRNFETHSPYSIMCQAKIRTPCFPCLLPHGWCGALSLAACLQNVTHGVEERGRCSLTHCSHRMSKDRRLSDNQRQDMTRPARTRTQQFNRGIESNESIISMA